MPLNINLFRPEVGDKVDTLSIGNRPIVKGYIYKVVQDDANRTGFEDYCQDIGVLTKGEGLESLDGHFQIDEDQLLGEEPVINFVGSDNAEYIFIPLN